MELWKSDGTAVGTVVVKDVYPGSVGSSPGALRQAGSGRTILLSADDGDQGSEVWGSDGLAVGTRRLSNIAAGGWGADPTEFTLVGSTFFFRANDGATGEELYSMPLAITGAVLAASFGQGCPGTNGSVPRLSAVGLPTLANPAFGAALSAGRRNATCVLAVQLQKTPLSFGCTVYVSNPQITLWTRTDVQGRSWFPLGVPNHPILLGVDIFFQAAVDDPAGGWFRSMSLSNGLILVVGRQ